MCVRTIFVFGYVAPYVGAWIETICVLLNFIVMLVAPYVGAWIETTSAANFSNSLGLSHPTWVRGLKHETFIYQSLSLSRTLRGCVD